MSGRFDPGKRTGPDACPLNAMYWDLLAQHRARLAQNPRMRLLLGDLDRMAADERAAIHATAEAHRATLTAVTPPWTFGDDDG